MSRSDFKILPDEGTPAMSPFRYQCIITDHIEAAHQLKLPYESKCNRLHGHTYRFRVVIGAAQLNSEAMVVDFTYVKAVLRQYDHQNLNEFFEPTTAEKFGEVLLDSLQAMVRRLNPSATVIEVGVGETDTTWVSISYNGS
jgi:6-pyruvoyltetrahydropterin/6-carboxytetrahydropterin synthase